VDKTKKQETWGFKIKFKIETQDQQKNFNKNVTYRLTQIKQMMMQIRNI